MDVDHCFGPSIGNVYGNKPFRNISGRPFPEVSVAIMMNISSRSVLPLFSTAFSVSQNIAAARLYQKHPLLPPPFPEVFVAIMMNISSRSVFLLFYTAISVRQNIAAGFILSARLYGVVYAVVAHIH